MAHIDIGQDSVLNLYSNVEISDGLQVAFSSAAQQYNYFNGRLVKQYTGMSYVYRNGVVKIQDTPQVVAKANYISFNNPSFESKPIYARIVDYQYVNNATVKIVYAVDWFQTFMFDVDYRSCQIMREHLSETDWAKAVANPWDRTILELNSTESFNFSDEDRGVISWSGDFHESVGAATIAPYIVMNIASAQYDAETYTHLKKWQNKFTAIDPGSNVPDEVNLSLKSVPVSNMIDNTPRASALYIMAPKATMSNDFDNSDEPSSISVFAYGLKALTEAGLTSEIIGVYYLSPSFIRAGLLGAFGSEHMDTFSISSRTCGGTNPKLKRAPFSYLRAISPNGDVKEYKYELFSNPKGGISFKYDATLSGMPSTALVPVNYRYGDVSETAGTNLCNLEERLENPMTIQIPYNIDAFLSYMSGIYSESAARLATPTWMKVASGVGNFASSVPETIAGGAMSGAGGGPAGMAAGAVAAAGGSAMSAFGGEMIQDLQAVNNLTMLRGSNPIYDYSAEKAKYIADEYHAGSGSFWYVRYGRVNYELFFMTLNDAMTETVDNYFNAFGYNSGRIGVPRVCNFIKGTGDQPHFVALDDGNCTYVKTGDMHVVSNLKPASDYIEALFNAGCRFINGNGR